MAAGISGNFAQVQAALAAVALRVEAANEVVEQEGAEMGAAIAVAQAPRFTGHMAASIDAEGGIIVVDTPYAVYQQYGTRHNEAQPFMPTEAQMAGPWRAAAERTYTIATR